MLLADAGTLPADMKWNCSEGTHFLAVRFSKSGRACRHMHCRKDSHMRGKDSHLARPASTCMVACWQDDILYDPSSPFEPFLGSQLGSHSLLGGACEVE
jgi:hypothetical protein